MLCFGCAFSRPVHVEISSFLAYGAVEGVCLRGQWAGFFIRSTEKYAIWATQRITAPRSTERIFVCKLRRVVFVRVCAPPAHSSHEPAAHTARPNNSLINLFTPNKATECEKRAKCFHTAVSRAVPDKSQPSSSSSPSPSRALF